MVERVIESRVLCVVLHTELSFERHVRSIAASASSKLGIMKALSLFGDPVLLSRCFWSFVLPVLEYCSPVWMSATASHLRLLDRVVSKADRVSDGLVVCDEEHRRRIAVLCLYYKIRCNPNHAFEAALPRVRLPARLTRLAVSVHSRYLDVLRCRSVKFGKSYVPACEQFWNSLD